MLRAVGRTIARLLRLALAVIATLIVLWAAHRVVTRPGREARQRGDQTELRIMHWAGGGGQKEDQIVADLIATFEASTRTSRSSGSTPATPRPSSPSSRR
jgi:peptidoglycan/LPS O-acetylase OafA/YrhL